MLGRFPNGNPTITTKKPIRALARRHQIGALAVPSLAAMGNFRNGWVVIGPRCARDLVWPGKCTYIAERIITS